METTISKRDILSKYMEYVLENEKAPKSIYAFSKSLKIEEKDFYQHYTSVESIATDVYKVFFEDAKQLLSADKSYKTLDAKNRLLSFYYTFFEILTANRSYVLLTLKENKNKFEQIKLLQPLKKEFKKFVNDLEIETIDLKKEALSNLQSKSIQELAWSQLVLILKFWIEDNSANFEKTDLFIEKSVLASFDLLAVAPLKNLIDFGKFLFKEKIKPQM